MNFDPEKNHDLDEVKDNEYAKAGDAILDNVGLKERIFYEETTAGRWWFENGGVEWVGRPNPLFDIFLKRCGINATREDKGCVSDMDLAKLHISLNYGVAYAGPLAGHKKGVKQNNGHRILVTRSPQIAYKLINGLY